VIAHAFNVLYIYQTKLSAGEITHSKSEFELVNDQTAGFKSYPDKEASLVNPADGRGSAKSKKARMKQKKLQMRGDGGIGELPTAMSAEDINSQVRSIALMFVDQEITDEDSLLDNGLDSLATAEFIGKLSITFKVNLPPTLVFHQPSIREIQDHIVGVLLADSVVVEVDTGGEMKTSSEASASQEEGQSTLQVANTPVGQPVIDLDSISVVIPGEEDGKSIDSLSLVESHSSDEDNMVEKPAGEGSSTEEGPHSTAPEVGNVAPTVSTLRSRVNAVDHGAGNTVAGNPWFSVFYASGVGDPRCRMVLCTGQAQGTAPWCSFAEILNSAGIDVYVVRIPGQFERGEEPPYEGSFADIVEEVCNGLADLGCLDDENGVSIEMPEQHGANTSTVRKSPAIPLVMLGFSLGTCFTIGLVQELQRSRGVEVSQVVSMGGLTHAKMKSLKSQTVVYTPDLLKETLLEFFGRAPGGLHQFLETADAESISTIMRYFDEGFRYAREWMADMDANNALMEAKGLKNNLNTDFLWIVGSRDISCPSGDPGWKNFVGENNQVEILVYPGDHFFHVENPDADRAVAVDVSRSLLRKLQIYA